MSESDVSKATELDEEMEGVLVFGDCNVLGLPVSSFIVGLEIETGLLGDACVPFCVNFQCKGNLLLVK